MGCVALGASFAWVNRSKGSVHEANKLGAIAPKIAFKSLCYD